MPAVEEHANQIDLEQASSSYAYPLATGDAGLYSRLFVFVKRVKCACEKITGHRKTDCSAASLGPLARVSPAAGSSGLLS